jgi:uncharacterized protein (TIGR03086 family)
VNAQSPEADPGRMLGLLARAVPVTRRLIAGVAADQWTARTPCPAWDVQQLVEHVIGGLARFADVGAGGTLDGASPPSVGPSEALAAFDEASARMLSAWSAPAVAGRTHPMPWGDTPGVALIGFMVMEQLAHGWDLARATGQRADYDDDVATGALALAEAYDDPSIRNPVMFGPVVEVAAGAPVIDRVVGFLGRAPDWTPAPAIDCEIVEIEAQPAVAVHGSVPFADLPNFFGKAFTMVSEAIERAGSAPTGPPFAFYPCMPTDVVEVEAGFPVASALGADDEVHPFELPGGRVVTTVHVGPYETMERTYAGLMAWMRDQHIEPAMGMWECYLSDPDAEPDPAGWRTRIVWPIGSGPARP